MVIITGADGFIGQHLIPLAIKHFQKKNIFCLTGTGKSVLAIRGKKLLKKERVKTLSINLLNKKEFAGLPKLPKIVIHLAANTDTASRNHDVNDRGTENLFSALNLSSKTHFIYTSTTVSYSGRHDIDKPITEKSIPKPTNEYGRTKFAAEKILIKFCKDNKIPLTILRLNTVYGDDPRKYKLFASMKDLVLKNSIIARLNWPGLTSLVHVDSVAEIIIKVAKKPPQPGEVQTFLVYSENLSLSEISKIMHSALDKTYKSINLPGFFWKICSDFSKLTPLLENYLSSGVYNVFWRTGLIVDNVIYCKSEKLVKKFPHWKKRLLKDFVEDTLV